MANIRIIDLPADVAPNASDVVAVDGTSTRKATLTDAVNAGRPFASQAEAEAGTSPTLGMSPLTTAQAIAAIGGAAFASTAQGIPAGGSTDQVLGKTGAGDFAVSWRNAGAGDLIAVNNLADVANAATALGNLGGLSSALAASTYLTQVSAAATYQPIGSYQPLAANLTSWGAVTRAAGFDTFASGPTSANLKALVTDETGSGALVFATSPALVTPALGTPTSGVVTNLTFTQTGAGAVSRTIPNKFTEILSVKDFGAVGDGLANDTTAIQAAETARAAIGGCLYFPPGNYLTGGTTINRAAGGSWQGVGNVRLLPNADSVILADLNGAVVSSTASKVFEIGGIEFHFNAHASVTGIRENAPYYTRITRCKFNRLQFSCIMTGPNSFAQTGWVTISDCDQVGEGSWFFRPFDDTKYIFNINIVNFNQQGTGAAPWAGVNALFHFQRGVSCYLTNVNAASLDGGTKGVYMQGDCQGIFLTSVIIGWATYGVHAVTWTDGIKPAYVYIINCGMDQPTVSGFDINGRTWRIVNSNSTNGYLRASTGPAVNIQATASDITIKDFLAAYMNHDGIKVNTGATKILLGSGITSENNNQIAGGNFDINLTACSFVDVVLEGRNYPGAAGVNATGQRVVNGTTSKEVSRNTGSAATTAVTTQEDLMTYTIPASVLKSGQTVRLTAWGTTAANANTKTVRLWFGGNSVIDHSGAWNTIPWRLQADIYVTGSSTQEYSSVGWPSANVQTVRQGTLTVTDTSTIIVKATGQNGTASAGDITCQGFRVEIID